MKNFFKHYRYLILRRTTQIGLMFLYFSANAWGFTFIMGNLSSSLIMGTIPLSDPYAVLQMFLAGAVITLDLALGAALLLLFYGIVGGRAFCSYVCPVNMITDAANALRRKLEINRVESKLFFSRSVRYWVLGMSLVISLMMGVAAFEFISPISMVHRGIIFGMGFGWSAALIIFLFDLFVLKNGWCGHICPLGGFYSLVGRFSLLRVHHYEEKCTLCMKCKAICPESQVLFMVGKESIPVLSGECTNCARCIEVCEDDALEFSIRDFAKRKSEEK